LLAQFATALGPQRTDDTGDAPPAGEHDGSTTPRQAPLPGDAARVIAGLDGLTRDQAGRFLLAYYDHHVGGKSLDTLFHGRPGQEEKFRLYTRFWRESGVLRQGLEFLASRNPAPPDGWDSIVNPTRRTVPLPEQAAERFGSRPGQTRDFTVPTGEGAALPARITQRQELPGSAHPRFEWHRTTGDDRDTVEAVVRLERGQPPAGARPETVTRAENELVRTMEAQINNGRTVTRGDGTTEQVPYTLRDGSELRLRVDIVDPGQTDPYDVHGRLTWGAPTQAGGAAQPGHGTAVPDVLSWFGLTESTESQVRRAVDESNRVETSARIEERIALRDEARAGRGTRRPAAGDWADSQDMRTEARDDADLARKARSEADHLFTRGDVTGALAKLAEARFRAAEALAYQQAAQELHPAPPAQAAPGTAAPQDRDVRRARAEAEAMHAEAAALRTLQRALDADEQLYRLNDPAQRDTVRDAVPPRVTAASLSRISALTAESASVRAPAYSEGLVTRDAWKTNDDLRRAREQAPVTTIGSPANASGVDSGTIREARRTDVPARRAGAGDPDARPLPGYPRAERGPDGLPEAPERVLPTRFRPYSSHAHFEVRRTPIPAELRTPGGPTHLRELTLRVKFDPNGVDPAVIADRKAAYLTTLDKVLNHQHRLPNPDGTPGDQLHVTVEDADDPGVTGPVHKHVTWLPTVDNRVPRSNENAWAVDAEPSALVHETLHPLGLADRYREHASEAAPSVLRSRPDQSRVDHASTNLMTRPNLPFAGLHQPDLDLLAELTRPALDRGNGGPAPYETPVRIADLPRDVRARIGAALHQDAPQLLGSPEQAIEFLAAHHDHHERGHSITDVSDNLSPIREPVNGVRKTLDSQEVQQRLQDTWQHWRASGALDTALAELRQHTAPGAGRGGSRTDPGSTPSASPTQPRPEPQDSEAESGPAGRRSDLSNDGPGFDASTPQGPTQASTPRTEDDALRQPTDVDRPAPAMPGEGRGARSASPAPSADGYDADSDSLSSTESADWDWADAPSWNWANLPGGHPARDGGDDALDVPVAAPDTEGSSSDVSSLGDDDSGTEHSGYASTAATSVSDGSVTLVDSDADDDSATLFSGSDAGDLDSDAESVPSLADDTGTQDGHSDSDSEPDTDAHPLAGPAFPDTLPVFSARTDSAPNGRSVTTPASGTAARPDAEGRDGAPSTQRRGDASTGSEGSGRGRGGRTVDEARAEAARAQAEVVRFETDLENTRTDFGLTDDDPYYLGGLIEAAQRRVTAAQAETDLAQTRLADARGSRTGTELARSEMDRARTELDHAQRDLAQARDRFTRAGGTFND
ncbi:hypothetical protein DEF28_25790, partial [Marinitenerispora sediminis]